jgi:hypothetical protein
VAIQYVGNVFILLSRLMVVPLVGIASHVCAVEMSCICQNPSENPNLFFSFAFVYVYLKYNSCVGFSYLKYYSCGDVLLYIHLY